MLSSAVKNFRVLQTTPTVRPACCSETEPGDADRKRRRHEGLTGEIRSQTEHLGRKAAWHTIVSGRSITESLSDKSDDRTAVRRGRKPVLEWKDRKSIVLRSAYWWMRFARYWTKRATRRHRLDVRTRPRPDFGGLGTPSRHRTDRMVPISRISATLHRHDTALSGPHGRGRPLQRGDRVILCGFGGGLTYGAALLEY